MKKDWIFDSPEEVKMYEEISEIVRQVIEDNPGITPTKIADIVLRKIDPDYGRTPITSLGAFLTFKQIATRMLRRGVSRKGRRKKPEPDDGGNRIKKKKEVTL